MALVCWLEIRELSRKPEIGRAQVRKRICESSREASVMGPALKVHTVNKNQKDRGRMEKRDGARSSSLCRDTDVPAFAACRRLCFLRARSRPAGMICINGLFSSKHIKEIFYLLSPCLYSPACANARISWGFSQGFIDEAQTNCFFLIAGSMLYCVLVCPPCAPYLTACVSAHGQMYSNRLLLVEKLLNALPFCVYLSSRDSMFL